MNDLDFVRLHPFYGRIEIQTRMRPEGNRLIGEGRSLHYDGDNKLTKDTGWQATGCELIWGDEPACARKWWEFWK